MQTADHLEKKHISLTTVVNLCSRFIRESQRLTSMQEDDTSQAGLPLQIGKPRGRDLCPVWPKVDDDKIIYHQQLTRKNRRRRSRLRPKSLKSNLDLTYVQAANSQTGVIAR